jgi:hypothetical protein
MAQLPFGTPSSLCAESAADIGRKIVSDLRGLWRFLLYANPPVALRCSNGRQLRSHRRRLIRFRTGPIFTKQRQHIRDGSPADPGQAGQRGCSGASRNDPRAVGRLGAKVYGRLSQGLIAKRDRLIAKLHAEGKTQQQVLQNLPRGLVQAGQARPKAIAV